MQASDKHQQDEEPVVSLTTGKPRKILNYTIQSSPTSFFLFSSFSVLLLFSESAVKPHPCLLKCIPNRKYLLNSAERTPHLPPHPAKDRTHENYFL